MLVYDLNLQIVYGDDGEYIWHVIQEFDDGVQEEVLGTGAEFTLDSAVREALDVIKNHVH